MGKRGELTQAIKDQSKELLGYEIDTIELRLMPYIMYVMVNEQKLSPDKLNAREREVLSRWRQAGHIEGGVAGLAITKAFWAILCEIVFQGYVDIES